MEFMCMVTYVPNSSWSCGASDKEDSNIGLHYVLVHQLCYVWCRISVAYCSPIRKCHRKSELKVHLIGGRKVPWNHHGCLYYRGTPNYRFYRRSFTATRVECNAQLRHEIITTHIKIRYHSSVNSNLPP